MSNEIQRLQEQMDAKSILLHFRESYDEESKTAKYEMPKQFFQVRIAYSTFVETHKLINLIEELGMFDFTVDGE